MRLSARRLFALGRVWDYLSGNLVLTAPARRKPRSLGLECLEAREVPATISQWTFNSLTPDNSYATGSLAPSTGGGSLSTFGGTRTSFNLGSVNGGSSDPSGDNTGMNIVGFPSASSGGLAGVAFAVDTTGYDRIALTFDQRNSNTASNTDRVQYSLDGGSSWQDHTTLMMSVGEQWAIGRTVDLSGVAGAADNPYFAVRLVNGGFTATNPGSNYTTQGTWRFDMVTLSGDALPVPTTTSLSSSAATTVYGQSVTFTATVSASVGTPGGVVTFFDGITQVGTGTLSGGVATLTTDALTVGSHTIVASYLGEGLFTSSSDATASVTVNKVPTTITLEVDRPSSGYGQSLTFTAYVSSSAGVPDGTVDFFDGSQKLSEQAAALVGGVAHFTLTTPLDPGDHPIRAVYNGTSLFLTSTTTAAADVVAPVVGTGTGLFGRYYDSQNLLLVSRAVVSAKVDFDWGADGPGLSSNDHFSARWTGKVQPQFTGDYTFYTYTDDGVRLWVNGEQIVDDWTSRPAAEKKATKTLSLEAGKLYDITMEYYEDTGDAVAKLLWSSDKQDKVVIPTTQLYPNTSTVTGRVWIDNDKNGRQDPGEKSDSSIKVRILDINNVDVVPGVRTGFGDEGYKFVVPAEGKYHVVFAPNVQKFTQLNVGPADKDSDADAAGKTAEFFAPAAGGTEAHKDAGFLPVTFDLDVNGNGQLGDDADGVANYLPGYEKGVVKLSPTAVQKMNLVAINLVPNTIYKFKQTTHSSQAGIASNAASEVFPNGADDNDFVLVGGDGKPVEKAYTYVSVTSDADGKAVIGLWARDFGGHTGVDLADSSEGKIESLEIVVDKDRDGLPDLWENLYTAGVPAGFTPFDKSNENTKSFGFPRKDGDRDDEIIAASTTVGDGMTAFDEYRGYIVNGTHKRTSPVDADDIGTLTLSSVGEGPRTGSTPDLKTFYPFWGVSLYANGALLKKMAAGGGGYVVTKRELVWTSNGGGNETAWFLDPIKFKPDGSLISSQSTAPGFDGGPLDMADGTTSIAYLSVINVDKGIDSKIGTISVKISYSLYIGNPDDVAAKFTKKGGTDTQVGGDEYQHKHYTNTDPAIAGVAVQSGNFTTDIKWDYFTPDTQPTFTSNAKTISGGPQRIGRSSPVPGYWTYSTAEQKWILKTP